jgi:hypothetical protein
MRTHTHYTQSQIDPFYELQILFIVSCLNVYPYTTIGSMEMFYELQTLENGFQVQMNTHTHNQNPYGNVL